MTDRVALLRPAVLKGARRLLGLQRAIRFWMADEGEFEDPLLHSLAGMPDVCSYTVFPVQMSFDVMEPWAGVAPVWTMVPVQPRPRTIVMSTNRLAEVPPAMVKLCAAIVFAMASLKIVVAPSDARGLGLPEEPHPVIPALSTTARNASAS